MQVEYYSYRFAQEILQHPNYSDAWKEIDSVIRGTPLFVWPGKSSKKPQLDVVQQLLNAYFDRRLGVDLAWEYHPRATGIVDSGLTADFRKKFGDLPIQVEVQFGNMARWYSDVFKFQTAYSQNQIRLALCVIPRLPLAIRIDQNIVNFERVLRELPSAELSLTLPILVAGVLPDADTPTIDVRRTRFKSPTQITRNVDNARRVINAYLDGVPTRAWGPNLPLGPIPGPPSEEDLEQPE